MSAVSEFLSVLLSTREGVCVCVGGGAWHRGSWERRLQADCEKKLVALPFWMLERAGTVRGHAFILSTGRLRLSLREHHVRGRTD